LRDAPYSSRIEIADELLKTIKKFVGNDFRFGAFIAEYNLSNFFEIFRQIQGEIFVESFVKLSFLS
jgi:hypothetical protein